MTRVPFASTVCGLFLPAASLAQNAVFAIVGGCRSNREQASVDKPPWIGLNGRLER